jgi:hypothetical protein
LRAWTIGKSGCGDQGKCPRNRAVPRSQCSKLAGRQRQAAQVLRSMNKINLCRATPHGERRIRQVPIDPCQQAGLAMPKRDSGSISVARTHSSGVKTGKKGTLCTGLRNFCKKIVDRSRSALRVDIGFMERTNPGGPALIARVPRAVPPLNQIRLNRPTPKTKPHTSSNRASSETCRPGARVPRCCI